MRRKTRGPAVAEPLESRQLLSGTNYYLSPTGSDLNAGTSASRPWQTIARANRATFSAGDQILFQGGKSFAGNLILTAADSGTATRPVTVDSYGSGVATISAGRGDGVTVRDASGVTISDLKIVGSGTATNTGSGINLFDDQTNKPRLGNINISGVDVSGFGFFGIGIGSATVTTGFDGVNITNSSAHDNTEAGVFSYAGNYTANPADYGLAHEHIYVSHVTTYDNPGGTGRNDWGNGIQLGNVNVGLIDRCVAYGNGVKSDSTNGGPVGIWAANSNKVTIQYCQSYSNHAGYRDGDGYDLDGGCTNCVVQYNYSQDNDGAGVLEAQFPLAQPSTGNIIRYNVSQNDGRKTLQAGIDLWAASASDTINGTQIYNNTIYLDKPAKGSPVGIEIDQATVNVHIYNNIICVAPGLKALKVSNAGTGLVFRDNDYWTGSATSLGIGWGNKNYPTLAAWQAATGQEKSGSAATGLAVDPGFKSAGGGYVMSDVNAISRMTAYTLTASSPLVAAGMKRSDEGATFAGVNYYNDLLSPSDRLDIGAD